MWEPRLVALAERPGEWARFPTKNSAAQAVNKAAKALSLDVEIVTRSEGSKRATYVRVVS